MLSAVELESFARDGWVITNLLDADQTAKLRQWVGDVQSWNDAGGWMNHYELTQHGPRRCRTEYFTPYHVGLQQVLCTGTMIAAASELLGEQAVLYKEKILSLIHI
ncbi:MAG: phytanoyl-CoA dioxygenase family protein, partial [Actinobacteria bacterium]|nr:phytanoyl-CoA dioxygenase family protein [Actinomycetota bacterium]